MNSGFSYQEWNVIVVFTMLILVWITQNPRVVSGWADLFPKGYKVLILRSLILCRTFCL